MPKKRRPQYTHSPIHTQSQPLSHSSASQPRRSVNERLAQLRREAAPPPTIEALNRLQTIASSQTRPPIIRGILGTPETAPIGARPSRRPRGIVAPPMSYVYTSGFVTVDDDDSRSKSTRELDRSRQRPRDLSHFASMISNSERLPKPNSLLHYVLKSMAMDWAEFIEVEQHNIAQLPIGMRSSLLLYISVYGPWDGIGKPTFKVLFPQADQDDISRLDLNGLLSANFDLVHLFRYLTKPPNNMKATKNAEPTSLTWEEQMEDLKIPGLLSSKPFENLTHLGLGNPGNNASWSQLLTLTSHLSRLTHLSLAYWPTPSLTSTTSPRISLLSLDKFHNMTLQDVQGHIRQAVQHFFTRRLEDFKDGAHVLKILSQHLYRLEYLDLEGCFDWLPALAWKELGRVRPLDHPGQAQNTEWAIDHDQMSFCPPFFPALTESWSSVVRIHTKQGRWIPNDVQSILKAPDGFIRNELLHHAGALSSHQIYPERPLNTVDIETIKWVEIEKQIRFTIARIAIIRHDIKQRRIQFDHGLQSRPEEMTLDDNGEGRRRGVATPPGFYDDIRIRRYNGIP